jgi:hypothetical protein
MPAEENKGTPQAIRDEPLEAEFRPAGGQVLRGPHDRIPPRPGYPVGSGVGAIA